jgi:hypothetical protein
MGIFQNESHDEIFNYPSDYIATTPGVSIWPVKYLDVEDNIYVIGVRLRKYEYEGQMESTLPDVLESHRDKLNAFVEMHEVFAQLRQQICIMVSDYDA